MTDYTKSGKITCGFVDIMFIYGQVDKIRPEEME